MSVWRELQDLGLFIMVAENGAADKKIPLLSKATPLGKGAVAKVCCTPVGVYSEIEPPELVKGPCRETYRFWARAAIANLKIMPRLRNVFRRIFVFIKYFPFVFFRLSFQGSFSLIFYRKERARCPEMPCALRTEGCMFIARARIRAHTLEKNAHRGMPHLAQIHANRCKTAPDRR